MSHSADTVRSGIDRTLSRQLAELMGTLSTPSRLLILGELRESARSVGELAAAVEMEPSAVSQQLRILRHLGFVVGTRRGRQVIYALHDAHVGALLDEAISHVAHRRLGLAGPIDQAVPEQTPA
jgi:DNA-binding transcriptional ArsR family regulator